MKDIPPDLASSNPREIALAVLEHFLDRDTDAGQLLHDLLRRGEVHGADARLATELTLGVLRQRSHLDALLETMTHRPWKKTPPTVRNVLRLGAYQLLFLDRIPAHAAVNESVALARRWTSAGHAALVNAILRRLSKSRGERPETGGGTEVRAETERAREGRGGDAGSLFSHPSPLTSDPSSWPVFYSHPPWLVQYCLAHFPAERVAALLEWNNQTPTLMLRANRLRVTAEQLAERLIAPGCEAVSPRHPALGALHSAIGWPTPESLALTGAIGDVSSANWFAEGLATVQDGAAQLIAHFVGPQPDERIVDWCAAPGGKSTHLAELGDDRAHILALDVAQERLAQVAVQAERLGLQSIKTYLLRPDLMSWLESHPADAILVDAPCTGLGTIQRHPDIRWRRKPKDLERSARLQLEILDAAARCVAPGGRLVYSTCTLGPVENEQAIERFLARHPQFERADPTEATDPVVRPFLNERGDLHTWPPQDRLDGFYAARLMRNG